MKTLIYSLLIIAIFSATVKAQKTPLESEQSIAELKATNLKLDLEVKAKTQEITELKKQALAKKLLAIKDKEAASKLRDEALALEQKAKQKQDEVTYLRKQIADNKTQLAELVKQTKTPISANTNVAKTLTNPISKPQAFLGDYVEIFELPNYQGKSVKYKINTEYKFITIPFSSNTISIKFSNEEKIIFYIAQESTKAVRTFLNSYTSISINTSDISSLIVGTKKKMEVNFNGIIYNVNYPSYSPGVHNNDCKKIYGELAYKLEMKIPTSFGWATTTLFPIGETVNRTTDGKINIFNVPKYKDYVSPFVYNESNAELTPKAKRRGPLNFPPNVKVLFSVADLPNAKKFFYVDSASYIERKNKYSFTAFVKVGSAHKGCEACTDFTWDAEMKTSDEVKLDLPYDIQSDYLDGTRRQRFRLDFIQVGPFRAPNYIGQLTKKDNFTGPPHATFFQFTTKIINP
ncbi:MAG: hypothetical protein V4546_16485 [Bacteroidota bacterium]